MFQKRENEREIESKRKRGEEIMREGVREIHTIWRGKQIAIPQGKGLVYAKIG